MGEESNSERTFGPLRIVLARECFAKLLDEQNKAVVTRIDPCKRKR